MARIEKISEKPSEKITLKSFWETVEQRLAACSAEELRDILRAMAKETPPAARQKFLAGLTPPEPASAAAVQQTDRQTDRQNVRRTVRRDVQQERLLSDIDNVAAELEAVVEGVESWRNEYWTGRYSYHDEDGPGPYRDFIEPLSRLFKRTEAVFDSGNLALARDAYRKLFAALDLKDAYGDYVSANDLKGVDIGEASARYLRAVYETEKPEHRPKALFDAMQQVRSATFLKQLSLDDIIQISPRPLPELDKFLSDWIAFLRKQRSREADFWLREAIRLSQGTRGLAEQAQTEGQKRPRAYLDWFAALEGEGKDREILAAAQQALRTLPAKLPIRAAIADYLCAAAAKLAQKEALRAGRWEAFAASPTLERLLDLRDATDPARRTEVMRRAAQHIQEYLAHQPRRNIYSVDGPDEFESPAWIEKSVLAHAHLLAGDWEAAQRLAVGRVPEWSEYENPQGLIVSCFLVLLAGRRRGALPPNLAEMWQEELQDSIRSESGLSNAGDKGGKSLLDRLKQAYAERLPGLRLSADEKAVMLSCCLKRAKQCVRAIVSNKQRAAYKRAAVLVAACAETLRRRGQEKDADRLLKFMRDRYPRHHSFQAELKKATNRR